MTHCIHEWPMGPWPCCLLASPNGAGVIQDEYSTEETETWCLVDYMDYPRLPYTHLEIWQGFISLGRTLPTEEPTPQNKYQSPVSVWRNHLAKAANTSVTNHAHEFTLMIFYRHTVSLQNIYNILALWHHVTSPCDNEAPASIALLGKVESVLSYFIPISIAFGESFVAFDVHPKPHEWHMLSSANIMLVANVQDSTACSSYQYISIV